MSRCPVTRCGVLLSSTARGVGTTSGEGADPHPTLPPTLPTPALPPPWPRPYLWTLTTLPAPPGAGHRWGPHPPATGAASPCIQHGSSLHAGTGTPTAAAPTPTPAQLPIATTGEVRAWHVPRDLPPLGAVYLTLTPTTSASRASHTKVPACFFHVPPEASVPRAT